MNRQSAPDRLCTALVLAVMTLAGIGFEAHACEKARGREQDLQQKKTSIQVKSYVCPMHPEVRSTKRGKCPKCKMDLRLERAVTSTAVTGDQNLLAANTASSAPGYARKMVIPEVDVLDQNGNALHFWLPHVSRPAPHSKLGLWRRRVCHGRDTRCVAVVTHGSWRSHDLQ